MRRSLLALGVSLAVHATVVAAAVGISAWGVFSLAPKIQLQAIAIDLVKDLPLGAPPAKEVEKPPAAATRVRKPRHRAPVVHGGVVVPATPDAGIPESRADAGPERKVVDGGSCIDAGRRRPGDLRKNGPEGSRVVALLRLDRLRASTGSEVTIAALDQLLVLLPDRRRLIDGTGFDLYRDFDDLLIATPNPRDPAVTFLAARHHLGDAALKAGLERGGKAANRPVRWRTIAGRPVGLRQLSKAGTASSASFDRDDRILVLPAAKLAIMATPAYATQLLGADPSEQPGTTSKPRATDAGAIDAGTTSSTAGAVRVRWDDIVARIDAEDAALPDDAVFMMTATNILVPAFAPAGIVVPPNTGTAQDIPAKTAPEPGQAPEVLSLVVGVEAPYIHVIAEFKAEAEAEKWEQDLPVWRGRLASNPVVLLSGFSPLIRRVEVSREGSTLELRVDTTLQEIQRLLTLLGNLARSALAAPR